MGKWSELMGYERSWICVQIQFPIWLFVRDVMKYTFVLVFLFGCTSAPTTEAGVHTTTGGAPGSTKAKVQSPKRAMPKARSGPRKTRTAPLRGHTKKQASPAAAHNIQESERVEQERCVEKCVRARQMEARDHRAIEAQCANGCRKKAATGRPAIKPAPETP